MKPVLSAALFALLSAPAFGQNVGVTVTVGQPGFYGEISIGNAPPPTVIYTQPMVIEPGGPPGPPIYLRVPPGYERDWRHHCQEYSACGRPVFFVQERWYNESYAPYYRAHEREYREREYREREHERDRDYRDRDRDREDYRDRERGYDRDREREHDRRGEGGDR